MKLFKKLLEVKRKISSGHYNDSGDWLASNNIVSVSIMGNVQPYVQGSIQGSTQKVLPDGVSLIDTKILYTNAHLQTSDEVEGKQADIVIINCKPYEVFSVVDFSEQLPNTSHYECLLVLQDALK